MSIIAAVSSVQYGVMGS